MKIAIIAAMQKELNLILNQLKHFTEYSMGEFTIYNGKFGNHDIFVSQCGIGKVNSALRTFRIITELKPELVINTGVAGGVDPSMRIGSVLVADAVAYHDVWCGPGTEYGAADGCPPLFKPCEKGVALMRDISADHDSDIRFGLLCSGDKFISKPSEVEEIKSNFPDALGCDMESASIAQTCCKAGVPFMVVRVMSDMPGGGENIAEYKNFWTVAPEKTFKVVADFIKRL